MYIFNKYNLNVTNTILGNIYIDAILRAFHHRKLLTFKENLLLFLYAFFYSALTGLEFSFGIRCMH